MLPPRTLVPTNYKHMTRMKSWRVVPELHNILTINIPPIKRGLWRREGKRGKRDLCHKYKLQDRQRYLYILSTELLIFDGFYYLSQSKSHSSIFSLSNEICSSDQSFIFQFQPSQHTLSIVVIRMETLVMLMWLAALDQQVLPNAIQIPSVHMATGRSVNAMVQVDLVSITVVPMGPIVFDFFRLRTVPMNFCFVQFILVESLASKECGMEIMDNVIGR